MQPDGSYIGRLEVYNFEEQRPVLPTPLGAVLRCMIRSCFKPDFNLHFTFDS